MKKILIIIGVGTETGFTSKEGNICAGNAKIINNLIGINNTVLIGGVPVHAKSHDVVQLINRELMCKPSHKNESHNVDYSSLSGKEPQKHFLNDIDIRKANVVVAIVEKPAFAGVAKEVSKHMFGKTVISKEMIENLSDDMAEFGAMVVVAEEGAKLYKENKEVKIAERVIAQ
jgi:hypothetical protein